MVASLSCKWGPGVAEGQLGWCVHAFDQGEVLSGDHTGLYFVHPLHDRLDSLAVATAEPVCGVHRDASGEPGRSGHNGGNCDLGTSGVADNDGVREVEVIKQTEQIGRHIRKEEVWA